MPGPHVFELFKCISKFSQTFIDEVCQKVVSGLFMFKKLSTTLNNYYTILVSY